MKYRNLYKHYGFVWIIFSNTAISQTNIDIANLSFLKFYLPKLEYKVGKVKQVSVYFESLTTKKQIVQQSLYDNNGYLKSMKNFDERNIGITETIRVYNKNNHAFIVNREMLSKHLSETNAATSSVCQWFLPFTKYIDIKRVQLIKINSSYKYTKDSSLSFNTYVNGKKVESGIMPTEFTIVMNDLSKLSNYITDTILSKDTMIVKSSSKMGDSISSLLKKYFKDNKLIKMERILHFKERDDYITFIKYEYDNIGRKKFEGHYGNNNKLYKGFFFEYNDVTNDYLVRHENYGNGGNIDSLVTYDSGEKILEETRFFVGMIANDTKLVKERIVYKYFKNGLIKEKEIWADKNVIRKYFYEYKFYL